MTDDDVIYGEMFDEIDLFADDNATVLVGQTDVLKYLGETKLLNIQYKLIGNKQTLKITGTAKDKAAASETLRTLILNVSRPLAGHFFDNGQMELFDQVKCDPSSLKNLRASELISRTENLLTICTDNPLALTACNILPAKIAEIATAKETFAGLSILPHDKIKARVDFGKQLKVVRNKILSIIKNKLTNAMYAFAGKNDQLLTRYLNIIKLVHTGVRHDQPAIPTTFKSFQLYSATTNEKLNHGMLQVFEMPKSYNSRIDGSVRNVIVPLGTCTIQVMAFGFVNYSVQHVITNDNQDVIAIYLTPVV